MLDTGGKSERASATEDRLARRVRDLVERLDGMAGSEGLAERLVKSWDDFSSVGQRCAPGVH